MRSVIFTSKYTLACMVMGHKSSEIYSGTNIIFLVSNLQKPLRQMYPANHIFMDEQTIRICMYKLVKLS